MIRAGFRLILYLSLSLYIYNTQASNDPSWDKVFTQVDSLIAQHKDYSTAKTILKQAIEHINTELKISIEANIRLIDLEIRVHNFQEALSIIHEVEAESAYSDNIDNYYLLKNYKAVIYCYTGRHDLAINIYEKLIAKHEVLDQDYYRLSRIYNALGVAMVSLKLEKAETKFFDAISYAKKANEINFPAYNNLIDFYIDNLNYKAAGLYIDTLIQGATEKENIPNLISAKTKQAHLFSKIGQSK